MNRNADAEVIAILRLVRMCQNTNSLPGPGGLLDQDSYYMYLFEHVLRYDDERQQIDQARQKVQAQSQIRR